MNKYKTYPEYKDSGVEWLNGIPYHWDQFKIKQMVDTKITDGPHETPVILDEGVPFLSAESVKNFKLDFNKKRGFISADVHKLFCKKVNPQRNDIFMVKSGATTGNIAIVDTDEEFSIWSPLALIRTSKYALPKFTFYYLQSSYFRIQVELYWSFGTQENIGMGVLENLISFLPPLSEQIPIVNFLDHETTKIDTLIEKQRQLIKLLKEKRQAVISHAVTKGLNPDAPMKDSGVEWLGEVPEHWEVKRLKSLVKIRKRIAGSLGYDVLSITQRGIKIKDISSGDGQLSMDYSKYQIVNEGDFAMNHMDLLTGFVDISSYNGVTSPDYRVFTLEDKNSKPEYYLYFMQMGYINKLFFPFGRGAAHIGRWRLPTEAFNEFRAPCPPESEQESISSFIQSNLEKINHLEEKARNAIGLMQERRTTLISAAVTGKIDVRDWKKPGDVV